MPNLKSTTLNPVFSEKRIAAQHEFIEKAQEEQNKSFDILDKLTNQAIKKKEKEPNDELKYAIMEHAIALVKRKNAKINYQKMIESNIAVLNGKTIKEIEQQFYDNQEEEFPKRNDNQVKKMYASWLQNRKEILKEKA